MMNGKKPSLAVLIGVGKPHGGADSGEEPPSSDEDQAYADAGDHLMAALKKGDGQAVADAVCALFDLHAASKDDHDGDEESESDDSKEY